MSGTRITHSITAQPWAITETNPFGLLRLVRDGDTSLASFTLREEQTLLALLQTRQARREAYAAALAVQG